ncbi:MAG: hypothetical protein ACM3SU_06770 [Acidobacteriota bacterium]
MTARLALAFSISLATGLLSVLLFLPERGRLRPSWLLKLSLASGLGLGLSSEVYFLWRWASGASTGSLLLADLLLLGGLGAALMRRRTRGFPSAGPPPAPPARSAPSRRPSPVERFLAIAVLIAFAAAAYAFVSASANHPHGGWDAWMSWNLRARFFFRAGGHWRDAFSPLFWGANPEYPVFLPTIVARLWQYSGGETQLAPVLVAALFTFATAALASSSLCLLRSRGQGLLAGLLLLGTPFLIQHGASQMADVPVGFFFLAGIVTLCLGDRLFPASARPFALTGLAAGLAAWTKNEGTLFLAALVLAAAAVLARERDRNGLAARGLAFAGGLLLVLPLGLCVKTQFAPRDLMLVWNAERLHDLIEWRRYWQIFEAFGFASLSFGNWPLQVTPLLAFYALLLGLDPEQPGHRSSRIALGAVGLLVAGYAFVYVTTPQDLAWHLRTSLQRVLLQIWPSAVFLFFLFLRTPEQALAAKAGPERQDDSRFAAPV